MCAPSVQGLAWVDMHAALGLAQAGQPKLHGWAFGRRCDVAPVQRALGPGAARIPQP